MWVEDIQRAPLNVREVCYSSKVFLRNIRSTYREQDRRYCESNIGLNKLWGLAVGGSFFSPFHSKRTSGPFFQFSFSHFFARGREYINQEWTEIREGKPGLAPSIFQNSEPVTPRASDERKCCLFSPPPKPQSYFSVHVFCLFSI